MIKRKKINQMKKFLVNEDNVGLRLDAFLKKNDDQDKSRVY